MTDDINLNSEDGPLPRATASTGPQLRIAELAQLGRLDYALARTAAAAEIGIKLELLDDLVKELRPQMPIESELVMFEQVTPWGSPVDGAVLLAELVATIMRFCILPEHAAIVMAAWIVLAWAHDAIEISPILLIISPEKRCGKTTLLRVLGSLVPRPMHSSNITAAGVFRVVDAYHPTLLIDEADTFLLKNDELRGILNCGYTRDTAGTMRMVGEQYQPKVFSTWCPKVLAMIGRAPDTIEDRALVISLRRKKSEEKVDRYRHACLMILLPVRQRVARWAADNLATLKDSDPEVPEALNDRAQDNARFICAIADLIGGPWPERVRVALVEVAGQTEDKPQSEGVQLLRDIIGVFEVRGVHQINSTDLCNELCRLEESPWADCGMGRALTTQGMARMLKPFGISPGRDRIERFYRRDSFADAVDRYLAGSAKTGATPDTTREIVTVVSREINVLTAGDSPDGILRAHVNIDVVGHQDEEALAPASDVDRPVSADAVILHEGYDHDIDSAGAQAPDDLADATGIDDPAQSGENDIVGGLPGTDKVDRHAPALDSTGVQLVACHLDPADKIPDTTDTAPEVVTENSLEIRGVSDDDARDGHTQGLAEDDPVDGKASSNVDHGASHADHMNDEGSVTLYVEEPQAGIDLIAHAKPLVADAGSVTTLAADAVALVVIPEADPQLVGDAMAALVVAGAETPLPAEALAPAADDKGHAPVREAGSTRAAAMTDLDQVADPAELAVAAVRHDEEVLVPSISPASVMGTPSIIDATMMNDVSGDGEGGKQDQSHSAPEPVAVASAVVNLVGPPDEKGSGAVSATAPGKAFEVATPTGSEAVQAGERCEGGKINNEAAFDGEGEVVIAVEEVATSRDLEGGQPVTTVTALEVVTENSFEIKSVTDDDGRDGPRQGLAEEPRLATPAMPGRNMAKGRPNAAIEAMRATFDMAPDAPSPWGYASNGDRLTALGRGVTDEKWAAMDALDRYGDPASFFDNGADKGVGRWGDKP